MKLIYIINSRLPTERAYGIQVAKMCEAFGRLGAEVVLFYPKRDNPLKAEDFFSYYGIEKIFKTRKLFSVDLLKYRFLNIFSFWLGATSFYLSIFCRLIFKFRDFKYVYTRDFYSAFILKILGKKIFFETHYLPKKISLFYRYFLKLNDGIIVITAKLKDELVKQGIGEGKILVLADGVDLNQFDIKISKREAREKLGLPQDKKTILYTGHLYEWKGASVLLEAARNFQFSISNFQNVLFIFVGGKEEDIKNFQFSINNFQLKNVFLAGHRSHREIPLWLKAADVLVLPNSGRFEISRFYTSPLKLFEYMASNRPIVASDLPSIREVLNYENAILVAPDSPELLAQAVKKVLENQELSDKISKKAFEDVGHYTWELRAGKIIDFVQNEKNS